MSDEVKPPIDVGWQINEDQCRSAMLAEINDAFHYLYTEALEKWFNNELGKALIYFIAEEGVIDIGFDDVEPSIKFWADCAKHDELICSKPLAGIVEGMIDAWGGDIDDDQCGADLRRKLHRLREVLLAAADKIETTLLPYGK